MPTVYADNIYVFKFYMKKMLNDKQVNDLFIKFSHPLVKSAITDNQKKVSLALSKMLWIALVGGNDTESQIHDILNTIFNGNRYAKIEIGSLYYFKMKTSLSKKEIKSLIFYYSIDKNIRNLENCLD